MKLVDGTAKERQQTPPQEPFSFFPARSLPPASLCPHCGDSYRAIVCPICKIPIGPALEEDDPEERKSKYPRLFYI